MNNNSNDETYKSSGINTNYHNALNIFSNEEIVEANRYADYWYYNNNLNTIPADVRSKNDNYISILYDWKQYQDRPIPQETFEMWKKTGLFAYGIAIITGEIFRGENKGKYTCVFDFDDPEVFSKFCESGGYDIGKLSHWTRTEWHGTNSYHVFLITNKPFENTPTGHGLEIMAYHKLIFVSNSKHPDNNRWTAIDNESISILNSSADMMFVEGIVKSVLPNYRADSKKSKARKKKDKAKGDELSDKSIKKIHVLISPYYMEENHVRDHITFGLSGLLYKNNISYESALKLIELIAEDDRETNSRIQVLNDTYKKDLETEDISGYIYLRDAARIPTQILDNI